MSDYEGESFAEWAKGVNSDEIVCPYCYYEFEDSWDFLGLSDENKIVMNCKACNKDFYMQHEYSVSYTTHRKLD